MAQHFDRVSLIVLDGVGCGEAADTRTKYPEDEGVNSLRNAADQHPLDAPALQRMGLEYVPGLDGSIRTRQSVTHGEVTGAFGALEPTFSGNGSPEGHQALGGLTVDRPYLLFNVTGIPEDIIRDIETEVAALVGRPVKVVRYPGTDDVNGVKFINTPGIGDAHLASLDPATGPLILPVYASSDSLVQIAIHQDVLSQTMIEQIGMLVRKKVLDEKRRRVARVIMRPFTGKPGNFERVSADRRDYSMDPDGLTLIDHLTNAGVPVRGIGKTASMFNGQGFPQGSSLKLHDDPERIRENLRIVREGARIGLIFTNLVGTDELWGHTRKPTDYLRHIGAMSGVMGEMMSAMDERDLLIVTSDHGNDPTQRRHSNHTRERVPVVAFHRGMRRPVELGIRDTYADVAATIAETLEVEGKLKTGRSFLRELVG